MNILKFMIVDMMRLKRMLWILLVFIALDLFLYTRMNNATMFSVGYLLFGGIVIASMPFRVENPQENGFLKMLPAKPGSDIEGHFVFGLAVVLFTFLSSWIVEFLGKLLTTLFPALAGAQGELPGQVAAAGLRPAMLGAALIMLGLQGLFLTIFRYNNLTAMQFLRMLPAFLYFLAMSSISDLDLQAVGQQIGALPLTPVLWGILLIGAAVFTICMLISARKH